jgi:G:T-mismatch repair DNA endonuclease (very short patch repair protein)
VDEIVALHGAGVTTPLIATQFHVSDTLIRKVLKAHGVALSKAHPGESNGMFGHTHSPATREKIREANRKQFSDPVARERHAILAAKQIASGRTGIRNNRLEKQVSTLLASEGHEFISQYRVGRFVFDFYIPSINTLVEANGTFWHADPRFYSCENLSAAQSHNVDNDRKKAAFAQASGFKLRIIWEADIMPRVYLPIASLLE